MLYTHIGGYTHVGWLAHALRFERTCWNIGFFKRKGQAAANLHEPSPPWRYKWIGENLCPLLIAKVIFYFFTTMFYPQFFIRHSWKRRTYRHFPLPSPIKTVPDKDREARDEKRNVQLPSLPASPTGCRKKILPLHQPKGMRSNELQSHVPQNGKKAITYAFPLPQRPLRRRCAPTPDIHQEANPHNLFSKGRTKLLNWLT